MGTCWERGVLTGMVGVEVAVGDGGDVLDRDAGIGQGVTDPPGDRVVSLVELLVAEPEPGIEQEHPAPVTDRIAHDHALPMGQLRLRKPERPKLEGDDLGQLGHASAGWLEARNGARRVGGRWQGGEEHRSERTPGCVSEERRRQRGQRADPRGVRRWRRGRDSNPRRVAPNRISSAAP